MKSWSGMMTVELERKGRIKNTSVIVYFLNTKENCLVCE